jgi:xylan 1,4-beta-xylosidase
MVSFDLKRKIPFYAKAFVLIVFVSFIAAGDDGRSAKAVISVDFAKPAANVKSMSGFLHGLYKTAPPDDLILPLKPAQWRFSENEPIYYERIKKSGARAQIVLSDFWGYTGLSTDRPWAYEDYPQFENFVRQLARANKSKDLIWDVWNEPEDARLPYWKGTFEQFCETYRRAYRVLREELGPDVMIGGPSFSRYDRALLTEFLNYCKTNGCEVNFLSWHELDESIVTSIPGRIEEARRLFVNNPEYTDLKIREIQINEIVGGDVQYSPGAILGHFYYLEKGGADGANKACWENSAGKSNCDDGALDGLVSTETFEPRAAWWAYKTYADGHASRVVSTTTNPKIVALASSQSDSANKAQVLIGFFKESILDSAKAGISINLNNLNNLPFLAKSRTARVKIEKIPDSGEKPITNLEFVSERNYSLFNSSLKISIKGAAANEAFLITIYRSELPAIAGGLYDCGLRIWDCGL